MKHIAAVVVLIALMTALAIIGLTRTDLMPKLASEEGIIVDQLFSLHVYLIAFLFTLIVVFMLYSVVVFRRKAGDSSDARHVHGNTTLEIVWTVVPFVVVIFVGVLGGRTLAQITAPNPGEMVVEVTASQWSWRFDYPEQGISSTELVLPEGRPILLQLTSTDVIHSFWVPEFRVKQDALPGRVTTLRLTPSELGAYKLRCAEMCGLSHAYMVADVNVVDAAGFETWVAQQAALAAAAASPVDLGASLYELQGCKACHSVDGSASVGPTWLGLYGKEETLSDGSSVRVDEAYLRNSIVSPGSQIVSGFTDIMPKDFGERLSDDQLGALIAYIKSLGAGS